MNFYHQYIDGTNVLTFKENDHVLKLYSEDITKVIKGE